MVMLASMAVKTTTPQPHPVDVRKFCGKPMSSTKVTKSVEPDSSTTCPALAIMWKTASSLPRYATTRSSRKRVIMKSE